MVDILLGLIGDNIADSQAPRLHRLAGRLTGIEVRYDTLIPRQIGSDFDTVFTECARGGYRGINVTLPYKERVVARVTVDDPLVRAVAAVNTVVFDGEGPKGYNTDYSGFIAAYRSVLGDTPPGPVCMIGAGGVGKAVAFALIALGLEGLRIVERDRPKAEALAASLRLAHADLMVSVADEATEAVRGARGLVNCTPIGMVGYGGTPLPASLMGDAAWAFDAVYTPVDTQFLRDAATQGLTVISGYELFFHQGVGAWDIFVGRPLDRAALRQALRDAATTDDVEQH